MNNLISSLKKLPPWAWVAAAFAIVVGAALFRRNSASIDYGDPIIIPDTQPVADNYQSTPGGPTSVELSIYDRNLLESVLTGQDSMYQLIGGIQGVAVESDAQQHSDYVQQVVKDEESPAAPAQAFNVSAEQSTQEKPSLDDFIKRLTSVKVDYDTPGGLTKAEARAQADTIRQQAKNAGLDVVILEQESLLRATGKKLSREEVLKLAPYLTEVK